MNVSMPIAAVMLDLGFAAAAVKAVPILARTAGLLAHLAEEQERPVGFLMAARGRGGGRATSADAGRRAVMLDPEVETPALGRAARARRRAATATSSRTCSSARRSTARSSRRRGSPAPRTAGGLADIARLPLTEKHELRATLHAREPDRRAPLRDRGRDRPHLLDERHDRDAELHPADGRATSTTGSPARRAATPPRASRAGQRIVSTYNAGPFVAGAALASFDGIGLCHIPVGTGNTERLLRAIELLRPEAAVLTPVVRRVPDRVGRRARHRPARARASSACSSRASPAAASRRSARRSRRAGARR